VRIVQGANLYIQYNGDQVASMTAVASNEQTTYSYDGDGLIIKATHTQGSVSSATTYAYTAESLTQTTESAGVTSTTLYTLDAQGYPTVATVNPPQEGEPVRYVHQYENCRLVGRVAYNGDGTVNDDFSAVYIYDASGRIDECSAPKDDEIYGYLDADDTCVMPS
jgi:YD repeat-containing protein